MAATGAIGLSIALPRLLPAFADGLHPGTSIVLRILAFQLAVANGVRAHHWKFGDMAPVKEVTPDDG